MNFIKVGNGIFNLKLVDSILKCGEHLFITIEGQTRKIELDDKEDCDLMYNEILNFLGNHCCMIDIELEIEALLYTDEK